MTLMMLNKGNVLGPCPPNIQIPSSGILVLGSPF